ncbi:DUF4097 domain-containing protein [Virgibacillus necropolis]|uniref:DUF4097 family beta strand repeat-containing protein n=1 Tax=Virgibacillus necropolis TaxID=163877 RepID=UPI00384C62CC
MVAFGLKKSMVDIHQQETVNAEQIDTISISTSSADIEVLPVAGDDIGVFLDGKMSENLAEKYEFKILQQANRLDISFKSNNQSVSFHFGINISISDVKLKVTLPEKNYEDIQTGTSSGDIRINKLASKSLTSTSSSGSQTISGLKIENRLFVKTSSGDIIANGNDAGKAMLRASSGEIKLRGFVCNDVRLDASSGDIFYHNDTISGNLECKASSGDVDIHVDELPESISLECRANSGDVNVRVDGLEFKERSDHRASASRGTGESSINARTSSGDIKVN